MMTEEFEGLEKLSPEERIRKLKEIEQKKKKEIEEAEKLILESITKIEEKKAAPIEEVKSDEIPEELSEEGKDIVRTRRFLQKKKLGRESAEESETEEAEEKQKQKQKQEATLEEVAAQAEPTEAKQIEYKIFEAYDTIKRLKQSYVGDEQKDEFYKAKKSIYEAKQSGVHVSNDAYRALDATSKFLEDVGYRRRKKLER